MIDLSSHCGAADQDTRRCTEPTPASDPAEPTDPRVATIAELGLHDAIDVEIQRYDDAIRTCGLKIAEERARRVVIAMEIVWLRRGAPP